MKLYILVEASTGEVDLSIDNIRTFLTKKDAKKALLASYKLCSRIR